MRKLLAWTMILVVFATASVGVTWAYLVNNNEDVNVLTVGRIEIEQLEYERADMEASGENVRIQRFHNHKLLYPGVYPDGYRFTTTQSKINWDSIGKTGYSSGIWNPRDVNNELDKMVFVRNRGDRDAYVRTVIAFETSAQWTLEQFLQRIHLNKNATDWTWEWVPTAVTIGEGLYYVAVATYQHVLPPDGISEISLSQVMMDESLTNEDIAALGGTYQILVYTQGVQSEGFTDPETALNEGFGAIDAVQVPFPDDTPNPGVPMSDAIRFLKADGVTDISTQVKNVVFGTCADYSEIPLTYDGISVEADSLQEIWAYYVPDEDGRYTVYVLSDDPIHAPADCSGLFKEMTALTAVNTDNLDVSRVENMQSMFYNCTALTEITGLESWNTGSVTNMSQMFMQSALTGDLDLTGWDVSNVTATDHMFKKCHNITKVNAAGWDTSSITNMRAMFYECLAVQSLNLTGWDTSNVTDTYTMLIRCRAMTELIGSGDLYFGNVVYMNSMCEGWDSMTYVDVSGWDCGNVQNMSQMFAWALKMENIDGIGNWDVSNVTNMNAMFYDSDNLTKLDLSGWNVASLTNAGNMFRDCAGLTELNLAGWNTAAMTNSSRMFLDSVNLETIYVSDVWDLSNVTSEYRTFFNNRKLVGGNGTVYSSAHTGTGYARIDRPAVLDEQGNVLTEAVPGYLTHINDKP